MQIYEFSKAHDLNKLHDEIRANVPTFHRATPDTRGIDTTDEDCGMVTGNGQQGTIYFADDIDAAAVQAVVGTHIP